MPRMATFARGGDDQRLWAKNQALIDSLDDDGAVEPERGKWVADPAQAEGVSWAQIAERVCGEARFKSTVQGWLRAGR